jgi:hypothetical protein
MYFIPGVSRPYRVTSERQRAHLVKARAARRADRFKAAQLPLLADSPVTHGFGDKNVAS